MSKKLIFGSSKVSSQPFNAFDLTGSHERFPFSFVYEKVLDEEKLIGSLQEMLRINPYFSARIVGSGKGSSIVLNNGGAEFSVERVKKSIPKYGLQNPLKNDKEYFCSFVSTAGFSDQTPLLKVKLFQFDDGSILSVTASHILTDGIGLFGFMKDWAAVANGREPEFHEHDRFTLIHDFEGVEKSLVNRLSKLSPNLEEGSFAKMDSITKIIRISQSLIKKIMEEQRGFLKSGDWVSTRDFLTALLWKNIMDFDQIDKDELIRLVTVCDIRKLLSLPSNYVGNAVTNRLNELLARDAVDMPVIGMARMLRESIESLTREDCLNDLMFLDQLLDEDRRDALYYRKPIPKNWVVVNNYSRFGWDRVDFGGEPVWFDIPAYPNVNRWVFILPSPRGDDFDCHVCLTEGEMELLEKNLINEFSGEILISPVCRPSAS